MPISCDSVTISHEWVVRQCHARRANGEHFATLSDVWQIQDGSESEGDMFWHFIFVALKNASSLKLISVSISS